MTVIYRLVSFFMLIATPFVGATHNATEFENCEEDGDVFIRVLIREKIAGALIDVKGGYRVTNPISKKTLSSGFFGKRYYLQANEAGLKWGEGYPGIHQIKITPKNENTSILIDGLQYKGSLEVYDINSNVFVVNELKVDDYLKSMLSSRFPEKKFSAKTWESLAIVARTNLYHAIAARGTPYWDLHSSEDQYQGYGIAYINPDIDRAVEATRSLVLLHNKKPFPTTWTENSAGQTANYQSIFRKNWGGPGGVMVAFAQKNREESRWKCALSKSELAQILDLKRVTSLDIYRDPASKKAYAIRIHGEENFLELTFIEFQKKVGSHRILSNDFSFHLAGEALIFDGYGEGLGVGLCLYSANEMAKIGDSVPQILSYFYPKTKLMKLGTIPDSLMSTSFE